jgi:hypothetical protein
MRCPICGSSGPLSSAAAALKRHDISAQGDVVPMIVEHHGIGTCVIVLGQVSFAAGGGGDGGGGHGEVRVVAF